MPPLSNDVTPGLEKECAGYADRVELSASGAAKEIGSGHRLGGCETQPARGGDGSVVADRRAGRRPISLGTPDGENGNDGLET